MATDVTTQSTELRILLADDHAAARVGMRRAIEPHGIRVVAEAANAADALALAHQVRPHVCVVAVGLPGNGIEAVRLIKQALPQTKLVVSAIAARDEEMFGALRAGAVGYLLMTMFHAGEMQSIYFLDRESADVWRYYSMARTGKASSSLTTGHEASWINRSVAFFRHTAGIPTDQEPPAAR